MSTQSLLRTFVRSAAAAAIVVFSSSSALAAYSQIVFFGDSLSDTGNLYAMTGIPASPPYANGRFSNGPLWTEDFAAALGHPGDAVATSAGGKNFALAGAMMTDTSQYGIPAQLAGYFGATGNLADPNALYVILGGANDIKYFLSNGMNASMASPYVIAAADAVVGMAQQLYLAGARNILVGDLPDLGLTPLANAYGIAGDATASTSDFNGELLLRLAQAEAVDAGLDVDILDLFGLLNKVESSPAAFGFTNVSAPCYDGTLGNNDGTECLNPEQYLFWDAFHPSAAAHVFMADAALSAVPEPGVLVLVIVAIAGLAGSRLRRGQGLV